MTQSARGAPTWGWGPTGPHSRCSPAAGGEMTGTAQFFHGVRRVLQEQRGSKCSSRTSRSWGTLSCLRWLGARNGTAQKAPVRGGSASWGPAPSAPGRLPEPTQGSGETPGNAVGSGVPGVPGVRGPRPGSRCIPAAPPAQLAAGGSRKRSPHPPRAAWPRAFFKT